MAFKDYERTKTGFRKVTRRKNIHHSEYMAMLLLRSAVRELQVAIPDYGFRLHSLTLEQLECFIEIALHEGSSVSEIAEHTGTPRRNISHHTFILSKDVHAGSNRPGLGWIKRVEVPNEDARLTTFYLTPRGKTVVERIARGME